MTVNKICNFSWFGPDFPYFSWDSPRWLYCGVVLPYRAMYSLTLCAPRPLCGPGRNLGPNFLNLQSKQLNGQTQTLTQDREADK